MENFIFVQCIFWVVVDDRLFFWVTASGGGWWGFFWVVLDGDGWCWVMVDREDIVATMPSPITSHHLAPLPIIDLNSLNKFLLSIYTFVLNMFALSG